MSRMDKLRKWSHIAFIPWAAIVTTVYLIDGSVHKDAMALFIVIASPAAAVLAASSLYLERYAASASKYIDTLEQIVLHKVVSAIDPEEAKKLFGKEEDK